MRHLEEVERWLDRIPDVRHPEKVERRGIGFRGVRHPDGMAVEKNSGTPGWNGGGEGFRV